MATAIAVVIGKFRESVDQPITPGCDYQITSISDTARTREIETPLKELYPEAVIRGLNECSTKTSPTGKAFAIDTLSTGPSRFVVVSRIHLLPEHTANARKYWHTEHVLLPLSDFDPSVLPSAKEYLSGSPNVNLMPVATNAVPVISKRSIPLAEIRENALEVAERILTGEQHSVPFDSVVFDRLACLLSFLPASILQTLDVKTTVANSAILLQISSPRQKCPISKRQSGIYREFTNDLIGAGACTSDALFPLLSEKFPARVKENTFEVMIESLNLVHADKYLQGKSDDLPSNPLSRESFFRLLPRLKFDKKSMLLLLKHFDLYWSELVNRNDSFTDSELGGLVHALAILDIEKLKSLRRQGDIPDVLVAKALKSCDLKSRVAEQTLNNEIIDDFEKRVPGDARWFGLLQQNVLPLLLERAGRMTFVVLRGLPDDGIHHSLLKCTPSELLSIMGEAFTARHHRIWLSTNLELTRRMLSDSSRPSVPPQPTDFYSAWDRFILDSAGKETGPREPIDRNSCARNLAELSSALRRHEPNPDVERQIGPFLSHLIFDTRMPSRGGFEAPPAWIVELCCQQMAYHGVIEKLRKVVIRYKRNANALSLAIAILRTLKYGDNNRSDQDRLLRLVFDPECKDSKPLHSRDLCPEMRWVLHLLRSDHSLLIPNTTDRFIGHPLLLFLRLKIERQLPEHGVWAEVIRQDIYDSRSAVHHWKHLIANARNFSVSPDWKRDFGGFRLY